VGPLSPRHGSFSGCGWRRRPPVWRVAANILNKQWQTAWVLGMGLTTLDRKKKACYERSQEASDINGFLG
jgi:hypothetical protein